MGVRILVGDVLDKIRELPDGSINTTITSPPYFGLRDYDIAGQIGLEATPEAYVEKMVAVFREVRRVLRDDGTLWLNLGDSYARNPSKGGSGPGGKNIAYSDTYSIAQSAKAGSSDGVVWRADRPGTRASGNGIKEKDLIGIPWMVAFALRADGWYLRQDIIWHKPAPMPESITDRCTKAHEYIFLLSKSRAYYFDQAAIAETAVGPAGGNIKPNRSFMHDPVKHRTKGGIAAGQQRARENGGYETRNKRSVWTVPPESFGGAHFATFPTGLVVPCVLAGCPEGGVVLDCFGGAGTTALVADRLRRNAIIIELNPEYAEMARQRVQGDAPMLEMMGATPIKEEHKTLFEGG